MEHHKYFKFGEHRIVKCEVCGREFETQARIVKYCQFPYQCKQLAARRRKKLKSDIIKNVKPNRV